MIDLTMDSATEEDIGFICNLCQYFQVDNIIDLIKKFDEIYWQSFSD